MSSITTEERIRNIQSYKAARDKEEKEKKAADAERVEKAKESIRALAPRIKAIISVGNACLDNGIPLQPERPTLKAAHGYEDGYFLADKLNNLVGFVWNPQKGHITSVGIRGTAGKADLSYKLDTDGVLIATEGLNQDIKDLAVLTFEHHFIEFEAAFYRYVDRLTKPEQKGSDIL